MNLGRCLLIAAIVLALATAIAVRWHETWARFRAGIPAAKPAARPLPEWTSNRQPVLDAFQEICQSNPDLTAAFQAIAQEEECA